MDRANKLEGFWKRLPSSRTLLNYSVPTLLLLGIGSAGLFYSSSPGHNAPVEQEVPMLPARPPAAALPPPPELRLLPVTPEEAAKINASIPFVESVGPAAKPFVVRSSLPHYTTALECLTTAIYYEAASESDNGQRAVAQVVLNRVRHPVYPASVCGVVYQGSERTTGCQFSFTCDGSLRRTPSSYGWRRARQLAVAALSGKVYSGVGNATHYHTNWVVPYWAKTLDKTAVIGAHIFYRWKGHWGTSSAFRQKYSGLETDPSAVLKSELLKKADVLSLDGSVLALQPEVVGGELDADQDQSSLKEGDAKLKNEGARVPVAGAARKPKLLADDQSGRLRDEHLLGSPASAKINRVPEQVATKCEQGSGTNAPAIRAVGRVEALDLRLKQC